MADIPADLLDKRILERNIHRGIVGRKDYDKYLKELPDVGDNAETVPFEAPQGPRSESGGGESESASQGASQSNGAA